MAPSAPAPPTSQLTAGRASTVATTPSTMPNTQRRRGVTGAGGQRPALGAVITASMSRSRYAVDRVGAARRRGCRRRGSRATSQQRRAAALRPAPSSGTVVTSSSSMIRGLVSATYAPTTAERATAAAVGTSAEAGAEAPRRESTAVTALLGTHGAGRREAGSAHAMSTPRRRLRTGAMMRPWSHGSAASVDLARR